MLEILDDPIDDALSGVGMIRADFCRRLLPTLEQRIIARNKIVKIMKNLLPIAFLLIRG